MTMRRIERAETKAIRNKTKTQLEQALEWRPGVVDRILDGTVTEEELAEHATYIFGGDSGTGTEVVSARANLGGLTASTAGTVTPGAPGTREEDEHAIFHHASQLVPLLARRSPSSTASRAAVTNLIDVMGEIANGMIVAENEGR